MSSSLSQFTVIWFLLKAGVSPSLSVVAGSIGMAVALPLSLWGGNIGDQYPRKNVFKKVAIAGLLISFAILSVYFLTGSIWLLILEAILLGVIPVFTLPVGVAAITTFLSPESAARGQTTLLNTYQVSMLAAPALGALIIALLGNNALVISIFIVFSFSLVSLFLKENLGHGQPDNKRKISVGLKEVIKVPMVSTLLIIGFIWNVTNIHNRLIIPLFESSFSATQVSVIFLAGAAAILISPLLLRPKKNLLQNVAVLMMIESLAMTALTVFDSLWLIIPTFVILASSTAAIVGGIAGARTLFLSDSLQSLTAASGQLLNRLGYVLATVLGATIFTFLNSYQTTFLLGGIAMFVLSVIVFIRSKDFVA